MAEAGPSFLMTVEDVFRLNRGRLVMASGRIERGRVRRGEEVALVGSGTETTARVAGIRHGGLEVGEACAGANVGLLLPGAVPGGPERGQVLAAPGSIRAHGVFTAEIAVSAEDEGGGEVRTGDALDCHLRTGAVRGVVTLPPGLDVLRPLHLAAVRIALDRPVPLESGRRFAFRRHGRAAGSGTVTRPLDRLTPPHRPNRRTPAPHHYVSDKPPAAPPPLPWTSTGKHTPNAEGHGPRP
ncbi:EF-Tu/IF-2/RF-3 family GTPase [Streptomyces pharetrae]|uniref:EF-Tu/IF-2/RF-3 family GTPase n=2 Tax=Streptomyces pharetrae TaxID=291370 RepID=UPI003665E556